MYRSMAPDTDTSTPVHGDEIRRLREGRGWTQDDLKTHAGASLSSVQRAERSDPTLKASTARRLARALGVPLARIYDVQEPDAVPDNEPPAWFVAAHEEQMVYLRAIAKKVGAHVGA